MSRGDDVVGVVAVTRAQVGGFTPAEIALLQTFADQAVIAVENARLLTELQAKNADLTEALEQQTATARNPEGDQPLADRFQPVLDTVAERGPSCAARARPVFLVRRRAAPYRGTRHHYGPSAGESSRSCPGAQRPPGLGRTILELTRRPNR